MVMKPAPKFNWQVIAAGDAGPGPRSRHGLVYDRSDRAAVLFGGVVWSSEALQNDTWELRGKEWTEVLTPESPPPRHRGAMVYLDSMEETLLFGGQGRRNVFLDDTWLYSEQEWTRFAPRRSWFSRSEVTTPSPRCGHSLTYDEKKGVAVLYGGIDPQDEPLGDTWLFDGEGWQELDIPGPPSRRYAAFAYDPNLHGCVLHGGSEDDNGQQTFRDAYLFKNNQWIPLGIRYNTSPRDDHGLAYHRTARRLVMLEGIVADRGVLIGESTGWEPAEVRPLHPRMQCSQLAWNEELGGLMMHGGETGHYGSNYDKTLLLRMVSGS